RVERSETRGRRRRVDRPTRISLRSIRATGPREDQCLDLDQRRRAGHMPICDSHDGAKPKTPSAFPAADDRTVPPMNGDRDAHEHGHHVPPPSPPPQAGEGREGASRDAKDPVCGMAVDPHTTPHQASHAGIDYFFCSSRCRTKFEADPARYLAAEKLPP